MERVSYADGLLMPQLPKLGLHSDNCQRTFQQYQPTEAVIAKMGLPVDAQDEKRPARQWPWRGFAFASDLGTVGYLVNRPQLGLLGWGLALPYCFFAILQQPAGLKRQEEVIYQATANGLFPLLEAKAGAVIGEIAANRLIPWAVKRFPASILSKLSKPVYKMLGSLMALAALTPMQGDPMSQWLLGQYRKHSMKETWHG